MFDYTHALNIISCMLEEQRTQPIVQLKLHFEENIMRQVQQLEPLQPEYPPIDNQEVEYLPYIINKIRNEQLIPHIHKFAHDYTAACKTKRTGNPPHQDFLQMFNSMMQDNKKYNITYNPDTDEEPVEKEKQPDDPPPYPESPEIKLTAYPEVTKFDDDESTIDGNEAEKPLNLFNNRTELRKYLDKKRQRQHDDKYEENDAKNHKEKHRLNQQEALLRNQTEAGVGTEKDHGAHPQNESQIITKDTRLTITAVTPHHPIAITNININYRNTNQDQDPNVIKHRPDHTQPTSTNPSSRYTIHGACQIQTNFIIQFWPMEQLS
jgi:hypothetical protein